MKHKDNVSSFDESVQISCLLGYQFESWFHRPDSPPDMIVGCDHQLGSTVKEDNCGVCNGDGSTCRLVRGQYKSQLLANKLDDTVVAIPYGSRHVRLVLKGPDHLYLETKTLQGVKGETSLSSTGSFLVDNSSVDFQKFPDKEILRMPGPLTADFTVKIHYAGAADSTVQFIFYQPIIHRWRETDFFPCSASCGGGYQLTSAECYDLRSNRVVADQYCHYYPENVKPKPKLQECNLDPCPARVGIIVPNSDGYKQIMPYDLYHPLPRWESTPWTACSSSCGGGIQSRTVSCVEEDIQGLVSSVEEWKCMYTPKMPIVQPCNVFDCPKWLAQEWSPCTVTCGQGLRYRVVLCIDYRGMHTGGCSPKTKPHIKEECIIPTPCYKPKEKLPVEAKLPWYKQAQELEEGTVVSEEPTIIELEGVMKAIESNPLLLQDTTLHHPTAIAVQILFERFIPEAWSACSVTCGVGIQVRLVKCQVLLSFSQSVADLPIDECEGPKPASERACYGGPCNGDTGEYSPEEIDLLYGGSQDFDELYDWEYEGFTECSESCGGGVQEAIVACLNKQTREFADENLCVSSRRPPPLLKSCSLEPCPPRQDLRYPKLYLKARGSSKIGTKGKELQSEENPNEFFSSVFTDGDAEQIPVPEPAYSGRKPKGLREIVVTKDEILNLIDNLKINKSPVPEATEDLEMGTSLVCKQFLNPNPSFYVKLPPESLQPVQHRWEIGKWSSCSLTCGVGLQTRDVFCSHLLSRETNETVILANELCHRPKPTMVQACNRFDCPPSWYLSEWQQCSQTCRGGIKKREVLCKQRMADGSFLELPETFCSTLRPASQQACKNEDCLPEWLLSDWTQCSVSCGEGTQTRNAICRKMLSTGLSAIINSSLCPPLPFSSLVKPCTLASCARHQRPAHKQPPLIMAQKKVFIQTRKQKKLHFIVGGYAYLLPKTSVILRCPVRRFRKPMITWEKDGKRLISSVHVTVAPYGYMKIHRLKPSDTGTYTCTAGPAQEHFVIKLIGGHNKRIVTLSAGMKEEETMKKGSLNEALHTQEKHQNGILFNGSKTEKRGLLTNPSSRYDYIVSRLLEYRGWPRENTEPWEAQDSTERNISSEEDQGQEFTLPSTMVANQDCLDDILRNLSQQPEELKDVYSKQLVAQLAHEIFRSHLEHQESLFKTQGSRVSSASVEFPFSKHFSEFTSSLRTSSSEAHLSTSLELINGSRGPHKKPAILKKISAAQQLSASEVVTHLGHTVVLASGTLSVLLHCEAVGNPKPAISWAKNGEPVQYSERILLQPDDSLQILQPVEADVGFYTCNATNALGSDSVSIAITLAGAEEKFALTFLRCLVLSGKPLIKTSRATVINKDVPTITVDIGSAVKTIPGVNVTISCQVAVLWGQLLEEFLGPFGMDLPVQSGPREKNYKKCALDFPSQSPDTQQLTKPLSKILKQKRYFVAMLFYREHFGEESLLKQYSQMLEYKKEFI
ncbi:ADAMTS-like protein 1 [Varanus komodoensis]|nr:ADAMTS-like protein 1 [Varanus komodoensis]